MSREQSRMKVLCSGFQIYLANGSSFHSLALGALVASLLEIHPLTHCLESRLSAGFLGECSAMLKGLPALKLIYSFICFITNSSTIL